jgi:molecular chaperone DnaK
MSFFGIDFGTTNTSAFDALTGRTYGDGFGSPLPSIVAIDRASNTPLIGRDAWEHRFELRERGDYEVIRSIKTLLDSSETWIGHKGQVWTVVDVAAALISELKQKVAKSGQVDVATAAFSVPVDLSPAARKTLRLAAERAGITVSTFVKESTAAIISEWSNVKSSQYVAVFDWGGGTLDISVVQLRATKIVELATKGLSLAGNLIDEEIARFVHGRIMARRCQSKELSELHPLAFNDLLVRCENAKCALSDSEVARFSLFNYDGKDEIIELTRAQLEPLLQPFVTRALEALYGGLRDAHLSFEALDQLIITGGCSKLWLFRDALANDARLAQLAHWTPQPEWAVARGAAILQRDPGGFELSESIAIELSDGSFLDLFKYGDRAGAAQSALTVALVEDARTANILLHRRSRLEDPYSLLLPVPVTVMGFNLEDIHLDLRLTSDLTLGITARSGRLNGHHTVNEETQELRFAYSLKGKEDQR